MKNSSNHTIYFSLLLLVFSLHIQINSTFFKDSVDQIAEKNNIVLPVHDIISAPGDIPEAISFPYKNISFIPFRIQKSALHFTFINSYIFKIILSVNHPIPCYKISLSAFTSGG